MSQPIDIMLPKETQDKRSLRERLKAGYLANAGENLRITAEWFPLEDEAWRTSRAGHEIKKTRPALVMNATEVEAKAPGLDRAGIACILKVDTYAK
jgi:hypothetical protein